jgi:ribosomal protein S13
MTDVYHENIDSEPFRADLTKIKGIGATTAEKLYNAKILTVQQISEMSPEKLSETPGIGLATASKFIAAAKNHLKVSQKEDIETEINKIHDTVKVESVSTSIERYEVEQVIVEEIEEIEEIEEEEIAPEEVEEFFESSKPDPKRFSNKLITEEVSTIFELDTTELEKHSKPSPQPEIEQETATEEDFAGAQDRLKQEDSSESEVLDYIPIEPKKVTLERSGNHQQFASIFKDLGCYEIPRSVESLKVFSINLDYLGCKLVKASDDLKFLFLFPVKQFDQEGTVLVEESKLELKLYSNDNSFRPISDITQITRNLLWIRDIMYEDATNGTIIRQFFQKYLQIDLRSENGNGNKNLVFLSGTTQYKVVIEPILLCNNRPRSMEKSLVFPYQRSTNLHAVTRSDLPPLVKFLEKKYRMIEKRTKKSSSINDYRKSEIKFSSNVKYASIPIFGFSVVLFVTYFTKLYFLLRLFNTIGLAVLGIYLSLLAFFYFGAYKTKKEYTDQLKTPYYLQALEFSETDLLDFQEGLTDELMTQFGYECLGKEASFGVIERVETKSLKNIVETERREPKFQIMFEPEQMKTETTTSSPTKYGGKYSSFLDDP